jgi:hypothetical protein
MDIAEFDKKVVVESDSDSEDETPDVDRLRELTVRRTRPFQW